MSSTLLVTPSSNWYSSAVTCVGEAFCACAAYNFVVLYDHNCTHVKAVLRAHSNKVTAVAAAKSGDEEVVLSGGRDKALIAWSVRRQCVMRKQKKLPAEVTALVVCPHDQDFAMAALGTGAVTLWKWKKGGQQHHANVLSSAASVLRSTTIQPGQQGVVLAGCEDGTIVGLDSATASVLWKLDVSAACTSRKSQVFKRPKSSGGAKGNNSKQGIQDISFTACSSEDTNEGQNSTDGVQSSQIGDRPLLVAVTTRSCQLAVFGWPAAQCAPRTNLSDPPHSDDCVSTELTVVAEPITEAPSASPQTEPQLGESPLAHKPTFLEQLSVPSPTNEVSWLPICWLPIHPPACKATDVHEEMISAPAHDLCTEPTNLGFETGNQLESSLQRPLPEENLETAAEPSTASADVSSTQQSPSTSKPEAQQLHAWLLLGLPSGKMYLWGVKVNAAALHELHELSWRSAHPPRPPERISAADAAAATGSWRDGGPGRSKLGGAADAVNSRSSNSMVWRKSSAMEVRPVKLHSDGTLTRMLFTVHAAPGSAQGSGTARAWQVVTTSYDRKTVSWELRLAADGGTAHLKACHSWTGTGADVLAICTGQDSCVVQAHLRQGSVASRRALIVSTGEKNLRRFSCHQAHTSGAHAGGHSGDAGCKPQPQLLQRATSCHADLFFQGISSEVTALGCLSSVIVAGCRDGTVGLIDINRPTLNAKFVRFSQRHDGPVLSCIARMSHALLHPQAHYGERHAAADGHLSDASVAVEIFTLGSDGNVLQWRGLPELAELHALLGSNLAAEKIAALVKAQPLAASLPECIQQMCTFSSMELVQSQLLLGGDQGHLLVVEAPEPGEHSFNTSLQPPSFIHAGCTLIHTARVTAVAGVPLAWSNALSEQTARAEHAPAMLVVAASVNGSVAVMAFDPHASSPAASLTRLAVLTDTSSAVSSLLMLPYPDRGAPADCSHACAPQNDEPVTPSTASTDSAAAAPAEHDRLPGWVLCACASDNVHLWTLALDPPAQAGHASHPGVPASPGDHVTLYCGTLKGLGSTAAPVCMRAISYESGALLQPGAGDVQHAASAAVWLVVACTDRSLRSWLVDRPLLEMHAAAKREMAAAALEKAATAEQAEQGPKDSVARSTAAAAAEAAIGDTTHEALASKPMDLPQAIVSDTAGSDMEADTRARSTANAAQPSSEQLQQQVGGDLLHTDQHKSDEACTLSAPDQYSLGPSAHNDQEPVLPGATEPLNPAHSPAPAPSLIPEEPHAHHDESLTPGATRAPGRQGAASGGAPAERDSSQTQKIHVAGSASASSVQESVASQLSRFVGVNRTAEVARLRPRGCVLGAQPMMHSFVDQRLSNRERVCLPGAATTAAESQGVLDELISFDASDDVAGRGGRKASQAAAGVRSAAVAAAQRTALFCLWQGDVCRALDTVVDADALNADFVGMAMGAGPEVWRAVVALYAAQLAACGEIHLAVSYLCSSGDFEQAVTVYKNSGLMLEALMLAERHLPGSSPLLCTLRASLHGQLSQVGGSQPPEALKAWSVEVLIANGDVELAIQTLLGKDAACSEGSLTRACEALVSKGHYVAAAELSCRAALGCSDAAVKSHWLHSAFSQDVAVSCIAAAIGIVQELLDSMLDSLISMIVASGARAVEFSDLVVEASRCCSHFSSHLEPALPSFNSRPLWSVPAGFVQVVLQRAVDAVNVVALRSRGCRADEAGLDILEEGKADAESKADGSSPDHLQNVAKSVLACVDAALVYLDSQGMLPSHLEDVTSSVPRLLPALALSTAHEQIPERVSVDMAACFVAGSLEAGVQEPDALAITSSNDNSDMQPSSASLDAWERYAAHKCSTYLSTTESDADIKDAGSVQASVWQSALAESRTALQRSSIDAEIEMSPEPASVSSTREQTGMDEREVKAEEAAVPTVSVLDSALQELGALSGGGSDVEVQQSLDWTPDSAVTCTDAGATPSPDRRRRKNARKSGLSLARADKLHWSEVEAYQRTVQAFTPQDWAMFRQQASAGGVMASVAPVAVRGEGSCVEGVQADVVRSGTVELERSGDESLSSEQTSHGATGVAATAVVAGASNAVDVVVAGWHAALHEHPGQPLVLK